MRKQGQISLHKDGSVILLRALETADSREVKRDNEQYRAIEHRIHSLFILGYSTRAEETEAAQDGDRDQREA